MTEQHERKIVGVKGYTGNSPATMPLTPDPNKTSKYSQWGALDSEDHWWLPPSHVRADLRKSLPSVTWQRTVLSVSFLLLTLVLSELVGTIFEPIYPPETAKEKFLYGVILLGSDALGGLANLFFGFELWFWTLAFGWGWWASLDHIVEAAVFLLDLLVRMYYDGPPEVGRCLHLMVCLNLRGLLTGKVLIKIYLRGQAYVAAIRKEARKETAPELQKDD